MDVSAADDRSRHLPPYPTPHYSAPPPMHRMSAYPPSGHQRPYDRPWHPHPSALDHHHDPRSLSNPPSSLPTPTYPPNHHRDLPPPPDASFARPNSLPAMANPVDSHPPMPSIPPMNGSPHAPVPQSAPPDYRSRMPFQSPDHPVNGEPSPYSAGPVQYATPHLPNSPYESSYYPNQQMGMRQRKPARAQQACDQCRSRKAKCDEGRPHCSHCKENGLECNYKDIPPHRQEKSTQLVLDRLDQLQATLDRVEFAQSQGTEVTTNKVQAAQADNAGRMDQLMTVQTEQSLKLDRYFYKDSKQSGNESVPASQAHGDHQPVKQEEAGAASPGADQEKRNSDPAQSDDAWMHTIPVSHSTAAHKLLRWAWIKHLLAPNQCDDDYVMQLEEERGLIRVYGSGEGDDANENITPDSSGAQGLPDASGYEKTLDIDRSGIVSAGPGVVRRYLRGYLEHMHMLHPFLNQRDLEAKVEGFIKKYCPGGDSISPTQMSGTGSLPRGAKRKRSDHSSRRVEGSIDNAIILLVLAVGCICDRRDDPLLWNDRSHPTNLNSGTSSQQGAAFSPVDGQTSFSSMSTIRSGPEPRPQKNMDFIPGLDYYAYAAFILGTLQGGFRLPYVQAALLAGIYAGQLAHPFQSHAWISQAAWACQILLRPKRFEKLQPGPEQDLCLFNYWTCFQLESDLLAELDLSRSGMSEMESRMTLPNGRFTMDFSSTQGQLVESNYRAALLYYAQIHLRKVLNRVHTDLYTEKRDTAKQAHLLGITLVQWRVTLPPALLWEDSDPPAEDINIARMRAKYYGGRYIVFRPVLYHYLEVYRPDTQTDPGVESQLWYYIDQQGRSMPSGPNGKSVCATLPEEKQAACKACIDSAMHSTRAFDGVKGGRPVVTNIFGTAHAQFGNMLVLSATYVSPLSDLVNGNDLDRLLRRTICFLEKIQNVSPTLQKDAEILRATYFKIFRTEPVIFGF